MLNTTAEPHVETFFSIDNLIVRLREVNGLQISKSAFLNGVRAGKYPQPVRPLPRRPVWKKSDIDSLLASFV